MGEIRGQEKEISDAVDRSEGVWAYKNSDSAILAGSLCPSLGIWATGGRTMSTTPFPMMPPSQEDDPRTIVKYDNHELADRYFDSACLA